MNFFVDSRPSLNMSDWSLIMPESLMELGWNHVWIRWSPSATLTALGHSCKNGGLPLSSSLFCVASSTSNVSWSLQDFADVPLKILKSMICSLLIDCCLRRRDKMRMEIPGCLQQESFCRYLVMPRSCASWHWMLSIQTYFFIKFYLMVVS